MIRLFTLFTARLAALTHFVWLGILSVLPVSVYSQSCSGTLDTTMYTTTLATTTGNQSDITWSFPQFPISSNTLYAVAIHSTINVISDMHITNNTGAAQSASARLYRTDDFYTDASTDYSQPVFGLSFNAGTLANGATKNYASTQSIFNETMVDSIYTGDPTGDNPANFLGSGSLNLYYSTGTSVIANPNNPNLLGYFNTISDKMKVTLIYYYCTPGALATNLISFTAIRENQQSILLNWNVANETPGTIYHVQVGTDGANFTDYAAVNGDPLNSNASYSYTYTIDPAASGSLYFRLRIEHLSQPSTFSIVNEINLSNNTATGFGIFPNPPSSFINLTLPGDNRSWLVDIFSADGRLVQRNAFVNASFVRVNFLERLAAGAYFVRARNPLSGISYSGSFLMNP